MLKKLRDDLYPILGESKRLVDCLQVVDRWVKGVWEGIPDNGVEVGWVKPFWVQRALM